jgi:hypothetical protein
VRCVCVCVCVCVCRSRPPNSAVLDAIGLPWEVFTVSTSDPDMQGFSSFEMLTKDGYLLGYQSLTVLVPELKGELPRDHDGAHRAGCGRAGQSEARRQRNCRMWSDLCVIVCTVGFFVAGTTSADSFDTDAPLLAAFNVVPLMYKALVEADPSTAPNQPPSPGDYVGTVRRVSRSCRPVCCQCGGVISVPKCGEGEEGGGQGFMNNVLVQVAATT